MTTAAKSFLKECGAEVLATDPQTQADYQAAMRSRARLMALLDRDANRGEYREFGGDRVKENDTDL